LNTFIGRVANFCRLGIILSTENTNRKATAIEKPAGIFSRVVPAIDSDFSKTTITVKTISWP